LITILTKNSAKGLIAQIPIHKKKTIIYMLILFLICSFGKNKNS